MSKLSLATVMGAAVFLVGCSHQAQPASAPEPSALTPPSAMEARPASPVPPIPPVEMAPPPVAVTPPISSIIVNYANGALDPAMLTIKPGETVTFKNSHSSVARLSRDTHPFHQCCAEFSGFDSDTLAPGATYNFTFPVKGVLEYHDHFSPGVMGKVVVE